MKRRNKIIAALIAINIVTAINVSAITVKAETDYASVENLVSQAISENSFYYYNLAYGKIISLPEGAEKEALLSKLSSIGSKVWTKDISEIVKSFEIMAKEKSGREYDGLEARIQKSTIKEIDKQYLYSELYSWGKDTVWTEDYKKAIAAVVKLWKEKNETTAVEAYRTINALKLQINKDYLKELFAEANGKVDSKLTVLDSKYFDSLTNPTYVGQGKSIYLDLTQDKKERTVTLKEIINNLYINAPLGTVKLDTVTAAEVLVEDISNNTLYLTGKTKLDKLTVKDKDKNAHIVLQGQATVGTAEITSGALIEVNVDSDVKTPFGKLILASAEEVTLKGDFKDSEIQVNQKGEIVITGNVKVLVISKEAAGAVITLAKGATVGEIKTEAAVKLEGEGTVTKVTGTGAPDVVNNTTPPTTGGGGGGGYYPPVETKYSIGLDYEGTDITILSNLSNIKVSEAYDQAMAKFDTLVTGFPAVKASAVAKVSAILTSVEKVELDNGKNLLEHVSGIILKKNSSSELGLALASKNAEGMLNYLKGTSYNDLYSAFIAQTTGGTFTIPEFASSAMTVKITDKDNKVVTKTTGDTVSINDLGITGEIGDLTLSQAKALKFEIEVSYGTTSYKITANNGVVTLITESGTYILKIK